MELTKPPGKGPDFEKTGESILWGKATGSRTVQPEERLSATEFV